MEIKDTIKYSDKKGEVDLLGDLQRCWVEAYAVKDFSLMIDIVDLFYMQLTAITIIPNAEDFEKRIEETRVDTLRHKKIRRSKGYIVPNGLGALNYKIFNNLRSMYLDLCKIKGSMDRLKE